MTLEADEFIRRFLLHVLPQGLQRIRYYGFNALSIQMQSWTFLRASVSVILTGLNSS